MVTVARGCVTPALQRRMAVSGDAGGWCGGGGRVEPLGGAAQRRERWGVPCVGCAMHGARKEACRWHEGFWCTHPNGI